MAVLGLTACTSANPAFDPTTAGSVGQGESTGTSTGVGESASGGTSNGGTVAGSEEADESHGSEGEPDACQADLYAINQNGALYLLDVDEGWSMSMVELQSQLSSWALATDPTTGILHVSQYGHPSTVWRVSPVSFIRDPVPVMVPGNNIVNIARAAFDPEGNLWLGTDGLGNLFISFPPGAEMASELLRPGLGAGGDMLFLEDGSVVVPSRDGNLWLTRLDAEVEPLQFPLAIQAVDGVPDLTGIARDPLGRAWVATVNGVLARVELDDLLDVDPGPVAPVVEVELGIFISDLAPIVVPPDGC